MVGNTFTITPVATPSQEVFGEVYTALSLNGQYNTPIRILIAGAKGKTLLRNADGVQTEITNNMAQDRADEMCIRDRWIQRYYSWNFYMRYCF